MRKVGEILISLENVNKVYKDKKNNVHALDNVSIVIEQGKFVVIRGESGAGKTSLLNIIGLIDQPTDGTYQLLNMQISRRNERNVSKLRNKLFGYVLQEYGLIDHYTVYENVEIPLLYSENKYTKEEKRKRVVEVLKQLGIEDKINTKASSLSGGQRQRVSIARALVNRPEIIIADEPTAALDRENATMIMDMLKKINELQGITVVMVSHDSRADEYADRIIKLEYGKIIN